MTCLCYSVTGECTRVQFILQSLWIVTGQLWPGTQRPVSTLALSLSLLTVYLPPIGHGHCPRTCCMWLLKFDYFQRDKLKSPSYWEVNVYKRDSVGKLRRAENGCHVVYSMRFCAKRVSYQKNSYCDAFKINCYALIY